MRAMADSIAGVGVIVRKIPLKDDPLCHPIVIGVRAEERMIDVDAGVDHDRRHAMAVEQLKSWIKPERCQVRHEVQ